MQRGDEAGKHCQGSDPDAIGPVALKGQVADGVDLLVELDPVIVIEQYRNRVTDHEADARAETADEQALQNEDALNLLASGSHGHENGDIAVLFHNEHDQDHQNIQCGNDLDQADGDNADNFFEFEGVQQRMVLIHPGGGDELWTDSIFGRAGDRGCFEDIVETKFDDIDDVVQVEHLLGGGERGEGPSGIEVAEARFEDAGHAESEETGNGAERR